MPTLQVLQVLMNILRNLLAITGMYRLALCPVNTFIVATFHKSITLEGSE